MRELKLKAWLVCMLVCLVGAAPAVLADWNPGDDHKMHFPQLPDPCGWDVCVVCQYIADDFMCSETGPVTDIHFWTSWRDDQVGDMDPTQWDISIWSDKPGEPNRPVWKWNGRGNVTTRQYGTGRQGWICPSPPPLIIPHDHTIYYQVNITNIAQPEPFIQQRGTIYWLVIKANITVLPSIGWKTSVDFPPNALWGNPALWSVDQIAWAQVNTGAVGGEPELHDMAFVITGGQEDREYGDAPEGDKANPVIAYPSLGVNGWFPTCKTVMTSGYVEHTSSGNAYFGNPFVFPGVDLEKDGNGGLCPPPGCFPPYDQDECFMDGDAGLIMPPSYTIQGAAVVPCVSSQTGALGTVCQIAQWGVDVDIAVVNMTNYDLYVNVLADWTQNGQWGDTATCPGGVIVSEHILVNLVVPAGYVGPLSGIPAPGPLTFMIGPNSGYVWFRFTLSDARVPDDWDGDGLFKEGETEDYLLQVQPEEEPKPPVPNLKWSQPPIELNPLSRVPVYCGWDEPSYTVEPPAGTIPTWKIVADDFRCLGNMPITSVHWWGSHLYWDGNEPPQPQPIAWHIGFWTNIPADPATDPNFSRPGKLLWQIPVDARRVHVEMVGKDWFPSPDTPSDTCFQYYVDLKRDEVFWQEDHNVQTRDKIFWISITAIYDPCQPQPPHVWGWKTRPWHWMDDAVTFQLQGDLQPGTEPPLSTLKPIKDPLLDQSYDVAFELDTDPNYVKWEQPFTGIRRWPHYEDEESMAIETTPVLIKYAQGPDLPEGMDVDATDDETVTTAQILADDFPCNSYGPITDIHIWGSWYNDEPPNPQANAVTFTLSIHDDVPDPNPYNPDDYSHPGKLRWSRTFNPGDFTVEPVPGTFQQGYFNPCTHQYWPANHIRAWKYNFSIDPCDAFVQEGPLPDGTERIYWLNVQAKPKSATFPARFGWKTSKEHWQDVAVFGVGREPYNGPWRRLFHPYTGERLDLAFEITSQGEPQIEIQRRVADDWPCDQNTPIVAAVWWGSYLDYQYQPCTTAITPRPKKPDYFLLSIWTDVPANPDDPDSFSHPGRKIWQYKAEHYNQVLVGFDKHPIDQPAPTREPVFRYSVRLPKKDWFLQDDANDIYWFSVVAVYKQQPPHPWGWTNHKHVHQDNAVAGYWDISGPVPVWKWIELYDQTQNSEDMSFILFTEPDCLNKNAPEYPNWLYWNKPDCWCFPRQCRGDINGLQQGLFWVSLQDLAVFKRCINKLEPLPPGCECADLNHQKQGLFWVSLQDLAIMATYINRLPLFVPICDQPPVYTGPYNFWTSP